PLDKVERPQISPCLDVHLLFPNLLYYNLLVSSRQVPFVHLAFLLVEYQILLLLLSSLSSFHLLLLFPGSHQDTLYRSALSTKDISHRTDSLSPSLLRAHNLNNQHTNHWIEWSP